MLGGGVPILKKDAPKWLRVSGIGFQVRRKAKVFQLAEKKWTGDVYLEKPPFAPKSLPGF